MEPGPFGTEPDGIGRRRTSWIVPGVAIDMSNWDYSHLLGPGPMIVAPNSIPCSDYIGHQLVEQAPIPSNGCYCTDPRYHKRNVEQIAELIVCAA